MLMDKILANILLLLPIASSWSTWHSSGVAVSPTRAIEVVGDGPVLIDTRCVGFVDNYQVETTNPKASFTVGLDFN
jgi:hypothetical protein|tara:strand:- start:806 stop:1033 length:228 start_codon:yes stop_codon:yes gene_type:complete